MSYQPNEQDEIVGDAMAVGRPAFVEELHYASTEAAEAVVSWDGDGEEPDAYRAIWVAFARKMVTERRLSLPSKNRAQDPPLTTADESATPETPSTCWRQWMV